MSVLIDNCFLLSWYCYEEAQELDLFCTSSEYDKTILGEGQWWF